MHGMKKGQWENECISPLLGKWKCGHASSAFLWGIQEGWHQTAGHSPGMEGTRFQVVAHLVAYKTQTKAKFRSMYKDLSSGTTR